MSALKATVYTWRGTPEDGEKKALGAVRLAGSIASWPSRLDALMQELTTRADDPLDPLLGEDFIAALPKALGSPPYLWAEVTGERSPAV